MVPSNVHDAGNIMSIIKKDANNIKPAEPNSPTFNAVCGFPPSFTFTKKVPIIDMIIPIEANTNGKYTAPNPLKESANAGTVAKAAPNTMVPIIEPT